nr:arylamine N-acetyltransferase [Actinopolymorpha cephalotaxi]
MVDRYLRHLQIPPPSTPSPDGLRLLHRAHLNHVPYENIEIQLGWPTSIDPAESVQRILTGRGGYCYHLNGSFGALLSSLGYDAAPVRATIRTSVGRRPWGSHLVVLVRFPQGLWLADVGLGDGFHDPAPLAAGMVDQPPFAYRLEHLGGPTWRFHHDRRSSIAGFDLDVRPVPLGEFRPMHEWMSTAPDSSFVRKFVVQARRADHTLVLRGCVLTRVDADGRTDRDVSAEDEWFGLLCNEFGLRVDAVGADLLSKLWQRVRASHEAWDRAGRP